MRVLFWAAVAVALTACSPDLGDVRDRLGDNPDPVNWDEEIVPDDPNGDGDAPTIIIDETEDLGEGQIRLAGTTVDDRAVTAVEVMVGASGPYAAVARGVGFGAWEIIVPAPAAGPIQLVATAFDALGQTGSAEAAIDRPVPADMAPPTIVIEAPAHESQTNAARLFVRGTTDDDTAVVSVDVSMEVDGNRLPIGPARTGSHFESWSIETALPPATDVLFIARATDLAGNVSEAQARVTSRAAPAHGAPRIASTDPADGAVLDSPFVTLRIELDAEAEIQQVLAGLADGPLVEATPADDAFTVQLRLSPGPNAVRVIAADVDGLLGRTVIGLDVDDGWPDGPTIALTPPGPPGGQVELDLDKNGVMEMFPVDVQRDTILMELDAGPMVRNALGVIRGACGEGWEGAHFAPPAEELNCQNPPPPGPFLLDCPADWGHAERNLWGLLTMTPANVNVDGTRLACVAARARPFLNVEFGDILGDALGIAGDEVMLADEPLVDAILENLIATHPNATPQGALPVTLEDGLLDMVPLGERFVQVGDHPGFIAGRVEAAVLTDDFRMALTLDSNLSIYEGIDLDPPRGSPNDLPIAPRKAYFADHDPNLPVVQLAFLTIQDFVLEGIAPAPVVAMDFQMVESALTATPGDAFEPVGQGNSDVWDFDPWLLERVVAEASINAFGDLRAGCDRCGGLDEGAMLYIDPANNTDLAEVTIGRVGYDCRDDVQCTNEVPTRPGITEHMSRLDQGGCANINECAERFGDDFICHPQGRCVDQNELECINDRQCDGGDVCLIGACMPAAGVECFDESECAGATTCHLGQCLPVPAGWFRMWMPDGVTILPQPTYIWDVVLEVAQARLRDFGVAEGDGTALFRLEDVSVGLTDDDIEVLVRDNLDAQKVTLATALLGAFTDPERPVDLYLDVIDGATWLMVSPCRIGRAYPARPPEPCGAPADTGLYATMPPARPDTPLGARLDVATPIGPSGISIDQLAVGQPIVFKDAEGVLTRIDIERADQDDVRLWIRRP